MCGPAPADVPDTLRPSRWPPVDPKPEEHHNQPSDQQTIVLEFGPACQLDYLESDTLPSQFVDTTVAAKENIDWRSSKSVMSGLSALPACWIR